MVTGKHHQQSLQEDKMTKKSRNEQFRKRRNGFLKKGDELHKLCGADVYILIHREGEYYTYLSTTARPPSLEEIDEYYPLAVKLTPANFGTPSRGRKQASPLVGQTFSGTDDQDQTRAPADQIAVRHPEKEEITSKDLSIRAGASANGSTGRSPISPGSPNRSGDGNAIDKASFYSHASFFNGGSFLVINYSQMTAPLKAALPYALFRWTLAGVKSIYTNHTSPATTTPTSNSGGKPLVLSPQDPDDELSTQELGEYLFQLAEEAANSSEPPGKRRKVMST